MFRGGVCLLISCFKIPTYKAMLNKELVLLLPQGQRNDFENYKVNDMEKIIFIFP